MAEGMALDLVSKRLVTDQLVLTVGYDAECLTRPEIREKYHGEITTNYYGKAVPKHAHGTFNFENEDVPILSTSSSGSQSYSFTASKQGQAFFGSRSRCPTIRARG